MSNKINYTQAPRDIAKELESAIKRIDDLIPGPQDLVRREEKERITIALDKKSLDLFRDYAKKHNAKYQNMINGVVEAYASTHLGK